MFKDSELNCKVADLTKLSDLKSVLDFLEKHLNGWVVGFSKRYSDDYPHLTCTWVETCKSLRCKPAEIMLVSYIPHKDDDTRLFLNSVCDIFSQSGFSIRRYTEFVACRVCKSLLPSKKAFKKLAVQPPFPWSNMCRHCVPVGKQENKTKIEIID